MRLLVVGDTHGDPDTVRKAYGVAVGHEVDYFVQVGDFGYWEHTASGRSFLDRCSNLAVSTGIPLVFLDGNHENHPLLWDTYVGSAKTPEGFWTVRPGLHYAPRAMRWVWGAKSFLAVGGAYSIDKSVRTPGSSWWATEEISVDEMDAARKGGKVDILLTHDAPLSVDPFEGRSVMVFPETRANRAKVDSIVEAVRPEILIHGHFHIRYSDVYVHRDAFETRIEGLAADGDAGSNFLMEV